MVKFKNEETKLVDGTKGTNESPYFMTFADIIIYCLNNIPAEGTAKTFKQEFKIEDSLTDLKAGKDIQLEDADFELVKQRISGKLPLKHRALVHLYDVVNNAR